MVHLLAEWYDTKSNIKLSRFRSQLQASYVSSHTEELWYNETACGWHIYIYIYIYPTPPYERDVTQSQFFKQSITGLNSEFSFSKTSFPYYLLITGGKNSWIHTISKGMSSPWNANNLILDLNSSPPIHFLWW